MKIVKVHIKNYGVVTLELNDEVAPKTVANFLEYMKKGHYDETIFHRVILGFMIQGGGFSASLKQKETGKEIEFEINSLKNEKYAIAMARTNQPHSATSQFFINCEDNGFLDHVAPTAVNWGYCVFGKVVDGKELIMQIAGVKTGRVSFHDDVPVVPVVIEKMELVEENGSPS